jgi:hypothetical protein
MCCVGGVINILYARQEVLGPHRFVVLTN